MADLVTHLATVLLPGALLGGRWLPAAVVGVVLPDVASRLPSFALANLDRLGLDVPAALREALSMLHLPSGLVVLCALLAHAFRERDRVPAFLALTGGAALHLALDLFQDHHGVGYPLLYPLSAKEWELGVLGSEATVGWAPWLAGATALAWAARGVVRWRRRRGA